MLHWLRIGLFIVVMGLGAGSLRAAEIDLSQAVIVSRAGELPQAEKIAPVILSEEVAKRTGFQWPVSTEPAAGGQPRIVLINASQLPPAHDPTATAKGPRPHAEGFQIATTPGSNGQGPVITITGNDARGVMFGVGKLLRTLWLEPGKAVLAEPLQVTEAPDRPIRGHQIGYRNTANSWDAWTYEQYDQYFRDMVIFGANAMENIPFEGGGQSPHMKYHRDEMNIRFGEMCAKYDIDHWVWVPVLVALPNAAEEVSFLRDQEAFYAKSKRLDAVFVPGGDPGDNTPRNLFPFLKRMAEVLAKYHPRAKIWLSMQRFRPEEQDDVYEYLTKEKPTWFGGLVMGPSSPPMDVTRQRLPAQYQLRWYPDITHCVRCQYPVPWFDPLWGLTLGREAVNPRPVDYSQIYEMDYRFTDGFVSYSDGVHDDFNKNLWSQLAWNPRRNPRDIAVDYAKFFFHPAIAETGADGLFALESNVRGAMRDSGGVEGTCQRWREMAAKTNIPASNWRFRMHLFRAVYDSYTRARLLYEVDLEQRALQQLSQAKTMGANAALQQARGTLQLASTQKVNPEQLAELYAFGEELFQSVGLQTSVPKYRASGYERGAVLDFVDHPLNNRWWLEDQFDQIEKLKDPQAQWQRIERILNWENPGVDGYYDAIGDVARSPRIAKLLMAGDVMRHWYEMPIPTQTWMEEKPNNLRLVWHVYLNSVPSGIEYKGLDPKSPYVVKLFAQRESPLMIDGVRAKRLKNGEVFGPVMEQWFEVPADSSRDGRITLTWDKLDERNLNWRKKHYVTDIWVMKHVKP